MLLVLSEADKSHLSFISTLPEQVLPDLVRTALSSVVTDKHITKSVLSAASKLEVDGDTLCSAITTLANCLLTAAQKHVSEGDFSASLLSSGVTGPVTGALTTVYSNNCELLRDTVTKATLKLGTMPLVMMCGYPCSGKTTVTEKLKVFLETRGRCVVIIGEDGIDRSAVYNSTTGTEKEHRGDLRSKVQKLINRDTVVILDSLNYIKGFRYELFCISKNFKTPHCVVHTVVDRETCTKWNETCQHYQPELIDELVMRFEAPNSRQRWDNPCFEVGKEGIVGQTLEDIDMALFSEGAAPRPNQSTLSPALAAPDFLAQVESMSQQVVDEIISQQSLGVTSFKIPGGLWRNGSIFVRNNFWKL
eukprot:sb/3465989/